MGKRRTYWKTTNSTGSKSTHAKDVSHNEKDYNLKTEKSPVRGFVIEFKDEKKIFMIYTDASRKNGKTGIGIHFPSCPENDVSKRLNDSVKIEEAEVKAIQHALELTLDLNDYKYKQIKICSDRLSIIESVQDYCLNSNYYYDLSPPLQKLIRTILKFKSGIILKHVYSHECCAGNNTADALARAAIGLQPSSNSRTKPPAKEMLIKTRSIYIRSFEPYSGYHEHAAVKNRSEVEIDEWMTSQQVTVEGGDIPRPIFAFNECQFPVEIDCLLYSSYNKPTVIQSVTWPIAMCGRDTILKSPNGTGKTLSYVMPVIMQCLQQPKSRNCKDGPIAVILLPNRELVKQVEGIARSFCYSMRISFTNLLLDNALDRGVDICITTTTRFLSFPVAIDLKRCKTLVLDEADELLNRHAKEVYNIINKIHEVKNGCQIIMVSATWSQKSSAAAFRLLSEQIVINVGSKSLYVNPKIKQNIEIIKEYNKQQRLINLLKNEIKVNEKVIVFFNSKQRITELHEELQKIGRAALCNHGDIAPKERDSAMNKFKEGKIAILLATDIAARGLDLNDIKYVVNYDYPNNSEDYVHRIGRTARGNNSGISYTFFTQQNGPKARDLIKVLEEAKQVIPEELQKFAKF